MELGAIGELLGGIAVIGSLIYVGLRVRQNTSATRAAAHHAFTDTANELNLFLARDTAFADLWLRWRGNRADLTESERLQGDCMALATLGLFETLFYQSRIGAVERQLLDSEEPGLEYIATPNFVAKEEKQ